MFSNASVHDVNALDFMTFETGSFYVMDKRYVDYKRHYKIRLCGAFFVTRAKDNMNYRCLYSHSKDSEKGVLYDQTILLNNHYASKYYPEKMRRIKFRDQESGKVLVFLTNNFHLKATDIAFLYKYRWDIEILFKWIKQHLKIKSFWGPKPAIKAVALLTVFFIINSLRSKVRISFPVPQLWITITMYSWYYAKRIG